MKSVSSGTYYKREFNKLADQWEADTVGFSFIERKAIHPAYKQIIQMGDNALLPMLERLRDKGGHWQIALTEITGENPAIDAQTMSKQRSAWLAWGRERGYFD